MDPSGQPTSAAQHRKGRRLRAALRHERQSIAMALAEFTHHSSRGQDGQGRGVGSRRVHGRVPEAPTPLEPGTRYYSLDDNDSVPELGGSRSDRLTGVRLQERVPRRIVEQIVDSAPVLPLLHDPVPQTVDSVGEVLKILDKLVPDVEQVIEVPSSLLEPQMAEQLVEVPGFEFVFVTRAEGALCLGVVRAAGHTWVIRVHITGWRDTASPGRYINTGTGDVFATMHDNFQQFPINSGWCLSSVHRQSGGYYRYATRSHSCNSLK